SRRHHRQPPADHRHRPGDHGEDARRSVAVDRSATAPRRAGTPRQGRPWEGRAGMKDLTVQLEDRPGTLAELGEALGNAGINIEGIAGFAVPGAGGLVHLLVEDGAAARAALE